MQMYSDWLTKLQLTVDRPHSLDKEVLLFLTKNF